MKIINFGSLNVDYVYGVDRFLLPGETKLVKSRSVHAGGKGLNQSIALARAGACVYHAGIVGNDGALLLETLKSSGVNTDYLVTSDQAGGHTIIQVTDDGQNNILLYGGTNRLLTKEYIDEVLGRFAQDDIVLLQNEVNMSAYIIERAYARGMRVAFNAAPVDSGTLSYPIDKTSWLIVNEIEGGGLTGETEPDAILSVLSEKYPKTALILTLGADGCRYLKGGEALSLRAYDVPDIVDTTGAGDTFVGYFLHSITQCSDVKKALERASAASALSIRKRGAAGAVPWADEVEGALKK